jgi:hypothetical protein
MIFKLDSIYQKFSNLCANDRRFLSTICFTDESTFTLNNEPNVQNTRYWAQENLRVNIPIYHSRCFGIRGGYDFIF